VSELSLTSAFCKSLYEDSVTLRTKHNALLAGIPGAPVASIEFPSGSATPLSQTPLSRNVSLSRPATNSVLDASSSSQSSSLHIRRSRKISVSPSDIALLSDQNAELLQKLEKLENESRQADQVGRRALKRLEKEIQGLRQELEMTQARSEELEERTRKGFGKGVESAVEDALRKKEERVARIRALRGKGNDSGSEEDEDFVIRDFAPGSAFPRSGWSGRLPPSPSKTSTAAAVIPLQPLEGTLLIGTGASQAVHDEDDTLPLLSDFPQDSAVPQQEYALISQLLLKIQELEETNAQIKLQQVETATKLQALQQDTEHIGRLYECLGDPDWEVVVDDDQDRNQQNSDVVADDTIRFKSLRRTLEKDISKHAASKTNPADVFESGIVSKNCSTVHGNALLNVNSHKQRKSVVGLFDAEQASGTSNSGSFLRSLHSDSDSIHQEPWSTEVNSPALSVLSLTTTPRHTLGSELGSDFGEDWGANASYHHLRASSLADLADFSRHSPSPFPIQLPSHAQELSESSTALQLTFEAPTPERPKTGNELETEGDQCTPRYRHMSQTIRSRSNRWTDGRFMNALPGSNDDPQVSAKGEGNSRTFSPLPNRFATAIDTVVETLTGRGLENTAVLKNGLAEGLDDLKDEQPHAKTGRRTEEKIRKKAAVAFVLEVWLWLQFAIIVLVFVWAVAKRGPKILLEDTERKRRARLGQLQ
jgi:hypothetical protein